MEDLCGWDADDLAYESDDFGWDADDLAYESDDFGWDAYDLEYNLMKEDEFFDDYYDHDCKTPSTRLSENWMRAVNKSQQNFPRGAEKIGKWMIFRSTDKIDHVWKQIKEAVEKGKLGISADVSTIKAQTAQRKDHVVCINTYDHTDETDVMRVREELRAMGFTEKLAYKTNTASKQKQTVCKYRR